MADGTAKYVTVRDHLGQRITLMSPGTQLPTESVLCQEYDVSRITVRRAVEDLIRAGRLVREQGRGTFVTEPSRLQHVRETFDDRVTGFYRQQTLLGREVTTTVIKKGLTRSPQAASFLEANPADELIELERLRYVDGVLHQHVLTYLVAARYPAFLELDLTQGSLYDFLEKTYGINLIRNDLIVRLGRVTAHVAQALGATPDACVLTIESVVFSNDGKPVAFGITHHTPDKSEISFSLRNQPSESHERMRGLEGE
jgi:DNA-binding GntR family transcriptional regulator